MDSIGKSIEAQMPNESDNKPAELISDRRRLVNLLGELLARHWLRKRQEAVAPDEETPEDPRAEET